MQASLVEREAAAWTAVARRPRFVTPIAALEFRDDGQGGTAVYFDRDDPGGGDWPFLITTLQGVAPSQIGAGDWIFR